VTSVIIAAHNEAAVIGRCLDALQAGAEPGEFDIVVAANGCTDATAEVAAARSGVRVLDLPVPGKVAALNAGDEVAASYPRVYLDADIVLTAASLRALREALAEAADTGSGVLAVAPRRQIDATHSAIPVRGYYAISSRLPAFTGALFGRGVVAISAAGRARFGQFPDVVADDLFLDSLFAAHEKAQVESVSSRVVAPRTTADLLRRLIRVRRGNASLRAVAASRPDSSRDSSSRHSSGQHSSLPGSVQVRAAARGSWLRDVALTSPALWPAAACYATITVIAAVAARLPQRSAGHWGRDESSRAAEPAGGPR
jgi:glycosyltransferase involved in cell wall biosynthesis